MAKVLVSDLLKQHEVTLRDLAQILKYHNDSVQKILDDEFIQKGGCESCRGRGWRVTWDTMDMMDGSCHEWGPCTNPDCTPETRRISGLAPSNSKYDYFHTNSVFDIEKDDRWISLCKSLTTQIAQIQRVVSSLRSELVRPFTLGEHVRVVKGRKLPHGTEGYVAFVHHNGGLLLKSKENFDAGRMSPAIGWANSGNLVRLVEEDDFKI